MTHTPLHITCIFICCCWGAATTHTDRKKQKIILNIVIVNKTVECTRLVYNIDIILFYFQFRFDCSDDKQDIRRLDKVYTHNK